MQNIINDTMILIFSLLFVLQCQGKEMKWSHIADLYHSSNGAETNSPGTPCFVHKLKYEHIPLTSFSKMRVDLAAQVMIIILACTKLFLHSLTE